MKLKTNTPEPQWFISVNNPSNTAPSCVSLSEREQAAPEPQVERAGRGPAGHAVRTALREAQQQQPAGSHEGAAQEGGLRVLREGECEGRKEWRRAGGGGGCLGVEEYEFCYTLPQSQKQVPLYCTQRSR